MNDILVELIWRFCSISPS